MSSSDTTSATAALHERLRQIAPILGVEIVDDSVGGLLADLADAVAHTPTGPRLWLFGTAIAGGYPARGEVEALRRGLELAAPTERLGASLSAMAGTAAAVRSNLVTIEVVSGLALVDVDFCAKNRHNTGIQRVVRSTVRHWPEASAVLASWSADGTGYRRLTPSQRLMVTDWSSDRDPAADAEPDVLLVPFNTTVVIPEVPAPALVERLAVLTEHSGNRVGLIGYDAIPLVSSDLVSVDESDRFAHYLTIVKHSTVVSGISETSADEFRDFASGLSAQGLSGPRVTALPLPTVSPDGAREPAHPRDKPLVLMVGSIEPRKNQLGVVAAAEQLWLSGLDFELAFIGGGGAPQVADLDRAIRAATQRGFSVSHLRGASDSVLADAYRDARFIVFPSLQEGYGLPVAEALASGKPVITSAYGSTAEIAASGGCILVDPRDDDAIAAAMRLLLTDDEEHARLAAETAGLSTLGWKDYADSLWHQLVLEGEPRG